MSQRSAKKRGSSDSVISAPNSTSPSVSQLESGDSSGPSKHQRLEAVNEHESVPQSAAAATAESDAAFQTLPAAAASQSTDGQRGLTPSAIRMRQHRERKRLEQEETRRIAREKAAAHRARRVADNVAAVQQQDSLKNKMQSESVADLPGRSPKKHKQAHTSAVAKDRAPARLKQRNLAADEDSKRQRAKLGLMSEVEFAAACSSVEFPAPPVQSNVAAAVQSAAKALSAEDVVCAVCDCFVPRNSEYELAPNYEEWTEDELLGSGAVDQHILHYSHLIKAAGAVGPKDLLLSPALVKYYDLSAVFPKLTGLLLSPHKNAYSLVDDSGNALAAPVLRVCRKWNCAQALQVPSQFPPPFAIANHNATGTLPPGLRGITWPEAAITCRVYACARINVLKGGAQKALQGHITTVEQNNAAMAEQLPLTPEETTFRVIIAGALTPAQKLATFKVHQVRRDVILQLLTFYKANNHIYDDVQIDMEKLNRYTGASSLIDLQGDAIHASQAKMMDAQLAMGAHDQVAGRVRNVSESAASSDDLHFHLRHVTAVESEDSAAANDSTAPRDATGARKWNDSFVDSARELLRTAVPNVQFHNGKREKGAAGAVGGDASAQPPAPPGPDEVLAIRCGSKFVREDKFVFSLMFPDLFPFGRGGLEEPRRTRLSLDRWAKRLLHESSGRFGNPSFVLKVYNIAARGEAARKCFLRVQLGDKSFEGLTKQTVRELVEFQLACSEAMRLHTELPEPPASVPAQARDLFKTMELCTAQMKHTDQYAKKFGRMRVFAMWNKFGPPALMLTLNPNDLSSLLRIFYCGLQTRAADGEVEVPPASVFSSSLADHPGAAALDFRRKLDVFIRHVIGYHMDAKTGAPVAAGGVYGPVLALFGAVEEQNRGSLHAHVLVWLPGVRPFSQLPANGPDGWEALRVRISEYVQSIMTAQVQCPDVFLQCPREHLHVVPSPPAVSDAGPAVAAAAELHDKTVGGIDHFGQISDVRQYRMPLRAKGAVGPPLIATCLRCDTKSESKALPFTVQSVTQSSIAHARASMGMDPVDPYSSSTFSQWSARRGPIFRLSASADAVDDPFSSVDAIPASASSAAASSSSTDQERLRYLVDIATVQIGCMSHDPAHRATCAKKGPGTECRFHFPFGPQVDSSQVVQLVDERGQEWKLSPDSAASVDSDSNPSAPDGISINLLRGGLSAYQNQTNLDVTGLYRCNNDVKFVSDPGSAFYITLYHVKTHDEEKKQLLDMIAAVERAHSFQVAEHPTLSADAPLVNAHSSSLSLALRAARAASSSCAISAPSAAYFLLGGERFFSSEPFGFIMLGSVEKKLTDESATIDARLVAAALIEEEEEDHLESGAQPRPKASVEDARQVYAVNALADYEFREVDPQFGLHGLSWWEYEQNFERVKKPPTLKASNQDKKMFLFSNQHPLHETFCAKRREREVTPIVYGDRLPDTRLLEGINADPQGQAKYAFRAMLLFVPFDTNTLKTSRSWETWMAKRGTVSACASRVMQNMQSYWEGSSKKAESVHRHGELQIDHVEENGDADLENAGGLDEQLQALVAAAELEAPCTNPTVQRILGTGSLDSFAQPDVADTRLELLKMPCPVRELAALKKAHFKTQANADAAGANASADANSQVNPATDAIAHSLPDPVPGRADWIKHAEQGAGSALARAPPDVKRSITAVCAAANAVTSREKANGAANLLRHVIATMELNTKQTLIFALLAQQFLAEVFKVDLKQADGAALLFAQQSDVPVDLRPGSVGGELQPVVAFLGGAAGTGKSRVIHAIKLLYQLCDRSSSLLITATTGVAAVALGACTIHSALNLMNKGELAGPGKQQMRERLAPVTLLIIDEVSMLGTQGFAEIEGRLSSVRPRAGKFGGLSMLFVGDFCQFNPVAATALSSGNASAEQWKEVVTTVVMLDEQMRQADNPTFAAHLQAFREGRVTEENVAYFNSKFVASGTKSAQAQATAVSVEAAAASSHFSKFVPIVVAENKDRVKVNDAVTLHLFNGGARASQSPATAEFKSGFFSIISAYEQTRVRDPDANKRASAHPASAGDGSFVRDAPLVALLGMQCTNKTDHVLRCFPGMEVVVTDNLCVAMGVANGSRAFVVDIQLTERAATEAPVFDIQGMRQFSVRQIARVVLHLLDGAGKPVSTVVDGVLPPGQFSVFPFDDYEVMAELKKNKALRGHKFPYSCKRVQFPFVPAFSITAHKTQGLTMPKLILAATLNRLNKAPTDRYLYVVLSRLRGLDGLTLLQPLPHHLHSCYKHSATLSAELNRLGRLESATANSDRARLLLQLLPPARRSAVLPQIIPVISTGNRSDLLRAMYEKIQARASASGGVVQRAHMHSIAAGPNPVVVHVPHAPTIPPSPLPAAPIAAAAAASHSDNTEQNDRPTDMELC